MSDDLTTDELTAGLHDLATRHETQPSLTAPEIRHRATRRGRRRRATLTVGATAATLALAAVALTTPDRGEAPAGRQAQPAGSPRNPSLPPTATPAAVAGTVNFQKQILTVDGRALRIASGSPTLVPAGLLTVSAKRDLDQGTAGQVPPTRCKFTEPYVLELRDAARTAIYLGSLTCPTTRTTGWIGLGAKDAVWLYDTLKPGDTLSVATPRA